MSKRKKRNKIDKGGLDLMKPINIEMFGSADDPCFGKMYSPIASECQKCGDCEICAIVTAQKGAVTKRISFESKHALKDLEEVDQEIKKALSNIIITNKITDWKEILKQIKKRFKFKELIEASAAVRKILPTIKNLKLIKKNGKRFVRVIKT